MNGEELATLRRAVAAAAGSADHTGWHPAVWDALEQIGVRALPVSESAGGAGADLATTAAVLMTLGSAGASVPLVEVGLGAGWLLERTGLRLPAGVVTVAVTPGLQTRREAHGWRISGRIARVPWGRQADSVTLLLELSGELHVLVVPLAQCSVHLGTNLAGEPRDDLVLTELLVPWADARVIGTRDAVTQVMRRLAFGRSALMAGAAQAVYAHAVKYAGERHQFGRSLAAMPVVQQLLAEIAGEVCAMTVAVEAAAEAAGHDPTREWVLDAARVRVADAARTVAAIGHQIHGAIGFTDEHPLYRVTTRLWAWREEYGNAARWGEQLGAHLASEPEISLWERVAV